MSYPPNMVSKVRGYIYTRRLAIKLARKGFWDASMGCIALRTELLHLHLSILGSETRAVSLHPADHAVLPFPYGAELYGSHCFWQIFFECGEGVITIVTKVFLDGAPEKLNEIEFTMKLGQYNAKMTSSLDYFLNK